MDKSQLLFLNHHLGSSLTLCHDAGLPVPSVQQVRVRRCFKEKIDDITNSFVASDLDYTLSGCGLNRTGAPCHKLVVQLRVRILIDSPLNNGRKVNPYKAYTCCGMDIGFTQEPPEPLLRCPWWPPQGWITGENS